MRRIWLIELVVLLGNFKAEKYRFTMFNQELKSAVTNGLLDSGVDVIDLGQTGTEEIYFAASF